MCRGQPCVASVPVEMCELNVKLDHIQPTEIDIWSKKVGDYHVFNTSKEVTPIISEVKGYGLHKRPIKVEPPMDDLNEDNTDQLIDQAQALIDTAKKFVTNLWVVNSLGNNQHQKLLNQRMNPRL